MPAIARLSAGILAGALVLSACGADRQAGGPPAAPRPTVTPPAAAVATATAAPEQPPAAPAEPAPAATAAAAPTRAATAAPPAAPAPDPAPAAHAGPLQFYWIDPPAGTAVNPIPELSSANEAGWSIAFAAPDSQENHVSLNGGERAPAGPDIGEPGTYKEELQVRGVPAVYESSGYGFRIAWREEGVNYNVVAGAAFSKEQVVELVRRLEPLTLEQWRARLADASR